MNPNAMRSPQDINPEDKKYLDIEVRELQQQDIEKLKALIYLTHENMGGTEESKIEYLESIIKNIDEFVVGKNERKYFIAADTDGKIIGMMGMKKPDPKDDITNPFVNSDKTIEVINAFVDPNNQSTGIGQALLDKIEEESKKQEMQEMIVYSGALFKQKGWPFWTKNFGNPIHTFADYWGVPNSDVVVWRKSI